MPLDLCSFEEDPKHGLCTSISPPNLYVIEALMGEGIDRPRDTYSVEPRKSLPVGPGPTRGKVVVYGFVIQAEREGFSRAFLKAAGGQA